MKGDLFQDAGDLGPVLSWYTKDPLTIRLIKIKSHRESEKLEQWRDVNKGKWGLPK